MDAAATASVPMAYVSVTTRSPESGSSSRQAATEYAYVYTPGVAFAESSRWTMDVSSVETVAPSVTLSRVHVALGKRGPVALSFPVNIG